VRVCLIQQVSFFGVCFSACKLKFQTVYCVLRMTVEQKGEDCKIVSCSLFISNSYFRFNLILVPSLTDENYWVFPIRHEVGSAQTLGAWSCRLLNIMQWHLIFSSYLLRFFPWQTNTMEQRPAWGGNRPSANQEIHHILCYSKVYYCIHKSPPLFPILSQINPVHVLPPIPVCEEPS